MPPRLNLLAARAAVPVFRQSATQSAPRRSAALGRCTNPGLRSIGGVQRRWNSSSSESGSAGKGMNVKKESIESMPHVSEEAAETSKILDKDKWCDGVPSTPELEQGTPISEILARDKEAQKHAPKVFQDQIKNARNGPSGSRSFSTSIRRSQFSAQENSRPRKDGKGELQASDPSAAVLKSMIADMNGQAEELFGLKFRPLKKLPTRENFRTRYEPVLEQFTKLLMRDGKLSSAQKNMTFILDHLRSAPPPQLNPRRRLLPGPPAPQLPLDPVLYLTWIVDSVAPLLKMRQQKGILGGGASVQIPVPLAQRQRRRTAIRWIIDASDKRRDTKFAQRVAHELVAVAEGRSAVWDRRDQVHKLGVAGRSNLSR